MAVVPGFTFNEETEMISALYSAVALMQRYEEESVDNKSYWMQRVEDFTKVAHYKEFQEELYDYPEPDTLFTKTQTELFTLLDIV